MSKEIPNNNSQEVLTPDNYREIATNGITFIADKKEEELEILDCIDDVESEIIDLKNQLKVLKSKLKEAKGAKRELRINLNNVRRYIKEGTRGIDSLNESIAYTGKVKVKTSYYNSLYNKKDES